MGFGPERVTVQPLMWEHLLWASWTVNPLEPAVPHPVGGEEVWADFSQLCASAGRQHLALTWGIRASPHISRQTALRWLAANSLEALRWFSIRSLHNGQLHNTSVSGSSLPLSHLCPPPWDHVPVKHEACKLLSKAMLWQEGRGAQTKTFLLQVNNDDNGTIKCQYLWSTYHVPNSVQNTLRVLTNLMPHMHFAQGICDEVTCPDLPRLEESRHEAG